MHHGCSTLFFTFSSLRIPMLACLQCICAGWKAWMMYRHHLIPTLKSRNSSISCHAEWLNLFSWSQKASSVSIKQLGRQRKSLLKPIAFVRKVRVWCMPYHAISLQFVLNCLVNSLLQLAEQHANISLPLYAAAVSTCCVIVRHVLVGQIAVVLWSNAAATNAQCSGTIASALEARLLTSLTIGGAQTLVPNPEVTYIAFVNDQPLKILPWFNVS